VLLEALLLTKGGQQRSRGAGSTSCRWPCATTKWRCHLRAGLPSLRQASSWTLQEMRIDSRIGPAVRARIVVFTVFPFASTSLAHYFS